MKTWKRMSDVLVVVFISLTIFVALPGSILAEEEPTSGGEQVSIGLTEGDTEPAEATSTVETDLVPESIDGSADNSEDENGIEQDKADLEEASESKGLIASTASTSTGGGEEGGVYSTPTAVDQVYTGAAVYNIPIVVPPGRKGVQPNLALTYNSYTSNGWIGVGWNLEIGSIERSTKRGMDYSANDYVSIRDGELVARTDWGTDYYGAKVEGGFSKYYFNNSTSGWEVTSKDGTKYYYGTTAASRQTNALGTSRWCLDKVQDTNGNYMTISYTTDSGQIYPAQIDYTGNSGLSTDKSVVFILESRDDEIISYNTKSEVITAKRLSSIRTYVNGSLAKEYQLIHDNNEDNGRSRLVSVQEKGDSGETTITATNFTWYEGGFINSNPFPTGIIIDTPELMTKAPMFGDINGDGNQDIVRLYLKYEQNLLGEWKYNLYCSLLISRPWISDGNFRKTGRLLKVFDNMPYYSDLWAQLGDVNGDGYDDLIYYIPSIPRDPDSDVHKVLLSNSSGMGYAPIIVDLYENSNWEALVGDINGDGKADYITTNSYSLYTYFANGEENLFDSPIVNSVNRIGADDSLSIFDANGDGLDDIFIEDGLGGGTIKLSNGDGTFTGSIYVPGGYVNNWRYFGDINGDGLLDLVTVTSHCVFSIYFATGNNSYVLKDTFQKWGSSLSGMTDMNGDGLSDLIISRSSSYDIHFSKGDGTFNYGACASTGMEGATYWHDINGDKKAELFKFGVYYTGVYIAQTDGPTDYLKTATNSLGGTTTVTYSNSSEYPDNNIPYVIYPISEISTDDGTLVSQTQYSYSGGIYDRESREFWGFENITRTNPDGSTEQTWYHQDPYLKGRAYRVEVKDHAESILKETDLVWDTYPVSPVTFGFVKLISKRTTFEDTPSLYTDTESTYDNTNGSMLSTVITGTNAEAITQTNTYVNKGNWVWRLQQESVTGATSGLVRQTTNTYETNTGNLLTTEAYNDGGTNPVVSMTYDAYGNVSTITDAEGNTTSTTYDASYTFPVTITLPTTGDVNHVTSQTWDSRFGKILTSTDQNGFVTGYTYDGYGRLTQVDSPDGGQVLYTYYDTATPYRYVQKHVKATTDSWVPSKAYYDGFGRVVRNESNGKNGVTIITRSLYDTMGRNYRTEGPFFSGATQFPYTEVVSYDYLSRPLTIQSPIDGSTYATVSYVYSGYSTTVTDADGGMKTQTTDHLGRIIEVEEQNGGTYTTTYEYNAAGDLIEITDASGNITSFTYDTLGRKTAMSDLDMGIWGYTYDSNGNLLTQTDAKNQVITFTYDELNRVTSKTYSPSNPMVYYFYDSGTNGIGFPYQVANANATTTYDSYDSMGRSTSVTKTITGDSARTTQTTYDLSGKVVRTTYPDGYYVTYTYHSGTNLIYGVLGPNEEIIARLFAYEPSGKLIISRFGNNATTSYEYNGYTARLSRIQTHVQGIGYHQDMQYEYSDSGDISSITDNIENIAYTYTYDDLHRLTDETNTGGFDAMQVTYDALGNITQKTVGPNTFYMDYDSSHKHAVDYVNYNSTNYYYTYDANGNMTQGYDFSDLSNIKVRTITYNVDNMPSSITCSVETTGPILIPWATGPIGTGSIPTASETTVALLYDGSGARAKKTVSGASPSTTYYIGNHFEVKDGTEIKYIFAGNLRVAQIKGSTRSYFHKDHLGSSTVMTDESGNLLESTNYEPFGGQRAHTGTVTSTYKFTDQEFDAESGLYNYDARMYDPVIGRFITPDSIIPDVYNPQSLNAYSYCLNNPLFYTDPTGHEELPYGCKATNDPGIMECDVCITELDVLIVTPILIQEIDFSPLINAIEQIIKLERQNQNLRQDGVVSFLFEEMHTAGLNDGSLIMLLNGPYIAAAWQEQLSSVNGLQLPSNILSFFHIYISDGSEGGEDSGIQEDRNSAPDPDITYEEKDGTPWKFKPKKNWDGKPTRSGDFPSADGTEWSKPTTHKSGHGRPHRDIQLRNGRHVTVEPKVEPKKRYIK